MKEIENFLQNLEYYRYYKGLTWDELGAMIGICKSKIYREKHNGGRNLTLKECINVCEKIHVDFNLMFSAMERNRWIELMYKYNL